MCPMLPGIYFVFFAVVFLMLLVFLMMFLLVFSTCVTRLGSAGTLSACPTNDRYDAHQTTGHNLQQTFDSPEFLSWYYSRFPEITDHRSQTEITMYNSAVEV